MLNVKIIKSWKRTSISVKVDESAQIIVKAPKWVLNNKINSILNENRQWIEKRIKLVKKNKINKKRFNNKEEHLYLGIKYKLYIIKNQEIPFYFKNGFYLLEKNKKKAKTYFEEWYKKQALEIISEKVKYYSQKYNIKYKSIKLSNAKTKWGSCTNRQRLRFSWQIIMAPEDVINYLIIHEITHIQESNHSKKYLEKIKEKEPNYKKYEKWLRKNGSLLHIFT